MVLKPLDTVKVRGVQVPCGEAEINDILGYTLRSHSYLKDLMQLKTFEENKAW